MCTKNAFCKDVIDLIKRQPSPKEALKMYVRVLGTKVTLEGKIFVSWVFISYDIILLMTKF